jgi:hypothetical protein
LLSQLESITALEAPGFDHVRISTIDAQATLNWYTSLHGLVCPERILLSGL